MKGEKEEKNRMEMACEGHLENVKLEIAARCVESTPSYGSKFYCGIRNPFHRREMFIFQHVSDKSWQRSIARPQDSSIM